MYFTFFSKNETPQSNNSYSLLRWSLTLIGACLYVLDITTDLHLVVKYFIEKTYVWSLLTLLFVSIGQFGTQIFSFEWFLDDINGTQTTGGMSNGRLAVLHIFGGGTIMRYWQLLRKGFIQVRRKSISEEQMQQRHENQKLFCMATDLTMLKLFESFLESAPQLLLQLYIWQHRNMESSMQYASLFFSFCSIAWALVDYRRCLRRSVPAYREMSTLSTFVYLLYKLFTLTSHFLSFSLYLSLSCQYTTIVLAFLWIIAFIWTNWLKTNFCSSKTLEYLYRAVVALILVFTFFNVKGKDTKIDMILYYSIYSLMNITAPILVIYLQPELHTHTIVLISLIFASLVLGLMLLVLYYSYLHPRGEPRQANEVGDEVDNTETNMKIRKVKNFLQP